MTSKGDIRKARKAARASGIITEALACKGMLASLPKLPKLKRQRRRNPEHASRAEQHGLYIDTGPQAWDDIGLSPDY